MDEVARIDSSAIDQIIAQASDTSAAIVVFAGRSGEWDQGRTGYVEQCFGVKPVVVRLAPFNEDEQRQLFTASFPGADFEAFVGEVRRFELGPLLGNPQFLKLLGEAYLESGRAFTSKPKIFADAAKRLAHEANPELGRQKTRPTTDDIVALGSEVFAKLLLSGATGVATVEQLSDRDFPYIGSLFRDARCSDFLIDTRLLKPSDDADKHEPVHRIVEEYCAARYLVKRIEDPSDRLSLARVFAIVAPNRVTRDELRGMLGWIAALGRELLQLAAIALDPYAVLANGDPGQLTTVAKRALLTALDELAERDPMFRRSDRWRRFNAGHFFTADMLDQVRAALGKPGALRGLLLELLVGTEVSSSLIPEFTVLMKDSGIDGETRKQALQVLLGALASYEPALDFTDLIAESSAEALEIASRMATKRGVSTVGVRQVGALLARLDSLYPEPGRRDRNRSSRYFIDVLIHSFNLAEVMTFLDDLTAGLACTCSAKHEFQCTCRFAKSKIVGRLLDRYFELSTGPHDPERVWSWLKALHFQGHVSGDRSAAVKHLTQNDDLRRSIQQLAVQGIVGEDAADNAVVKLYSTNSHSGLLVREEDIRALSQYAFDHRLVDVWTALLYGHNNHSDVKEPNPTRAFQRRQSRTSPDFLAAWSRREKRRRSYAKENRKARRHRSYRRYARREAAIKENNRTHLRENIAEIEAGRHWWWLQRFAQDYLWHPDELADLVDDPETPLRAFRNCLPMLDPHIPSIEGLGRRERSDIAKVLLAVCVVLFRDGVRLETVDARVLAAAKTEEYAYPTFADGERDAFEAALDAALFKESGYAEAFVRRYMEQQLGATEEVSVNVDWLDYRPAFQHLRATLPLDWLEQFPKMPIAAARTLFNMAAKYGNRDKLLALIDRRIADPVTDSGNNTLANNQARMRRSFWQLNAFLYQASGGDAAWEDLKTDPKTIFALEQRLGRP